MLIFLAANWYTEVNVAIFENLTAITWMDFDVFYGYSACSVSSNALLHFFFIMTLTKDYDSWKASTVSSWAADITLSSR